MTKYKELKSLSEFEMFDGTLESIKSHISMRMFNKDNLPFDKSLDSIPHSLFVDLVSTFSVENKTYFDKKNKGVICYMLTNEDIEKFNIDKDTLLIIANKNIMKNNSVRIESIQEHIIRSNVMHPLTRIPSDATLMMGGNSRANNNSIFRGSSELPIINNQNKDDVLLISNRTQTFAAINFLFNDTLTRLYEKFKENFYMIPMSVHELICIRESYASKNGELSQKETVEELADMVEQVNDTMISNTADILSYNIYYHSLDDYCTMIVSQ